MNSHEVVRRQSGKGKRTGRRARSRRATTEVEGLEGRTLPAVSFVPQAQVIPFGPSPASIALADLNGDGRADFVGAGSGGVVVRLGNGDGTFGPATTFDPSQDPLAVAVGDFNGDGVPDVVVAEGLYSPLEIYEPPPPHFEQPGTPLPPPIIIPEQPSHVVVFLGRGDGTFQAGLSAQVAPVPDALAVGDFNGDGRLDLAVGNKGAPDGAGGWTGGDLTILPGHGDGTFGTPTTVPQAGNQPMIALAAGDFNGDGRPDLAEVFGQAGGAGSPPGSLEVRLGRGDGTFGPATAIDPGLPQPMAVAVGDFNGDARPDLAVARDYLDGTVEVLTGQGDGTFRDARSYAVGRTPDAIVAGDFDRDGTLDLAVADKESGDVSILAGDGDGTFQAAPSYALVPGQVTTLGDVNGDGVPDLVSAGYDGATEVGVLLGDGDGRFRALSVLQITPMVNYRAIVLGDVNGDGVPDLVLGAGGIFTTSISDDQPPVSYFDDAGIIVLPGHGDGTFGAPETIPETERSPTALALADVNGDGKLDLVEAYHLGDPSSTMGGVAVRLGHGDGTFGPSTDLYQGDGGPVALAVRDVDCDGKPDILAAEAAGDDVAVLIGDGDGTFGAPARFAAGPSPGSIAVADLDGGGVPDLVIGDLGTPSTPASLGEYAGGEVVLLAGRGDGSFGPPTVLDRGDEPVTSVAVADLNRDGTPDVVATDNALLMATVQGTSGDPAGMVKVLLGRPSAPGTFAPASAAPVLPDVSAVLVGDLNRDGTRDLVVVGDVDRTATVLPGRGEGTFLDTPRVAVSPVPTALALGDLDGDGRADLVSAGSLDSTATVLRNESPVTDFPISASGVPVTATAGVAGIRITVATLTDSDPLGLASDFTATIDWGDATPTSAGTITPSGPGRFLVSGGHTYARPGSYPILVTIRDILGSTADAATVAATAPPPITPVSIALTSPAGTGLVGQSYTVTATVTGQDGSPVGAGIPVTFAVIAGPNAGASGITDPADGRTDASGRVNFTYVGAGAGTDTVVATGMIPGHAAPVTSGATVTWAAAPPPTVVSVQRLGVHRQRTRLLLFFSVPLDPGRAQAPSNYTLTTTGRRRRSIAIDAARYDPATRSVTLFPHGRLSLHQAYRLTVRGSGPRGVASSLGVPLDGAFQGEPGGDFTTRVFGGGFPRWAGAVGPGLSNSPLGKDGPTAAAVDALFSR